MFLSEFLCYVLFLVVIPGVNGWWSIDVYISTIVLVYIMNHFLVNSECSISCLYIIIIPGLFIKKQKQNKTQTTQKISNIEIVDICQFCVHVFALPFYTHYVGDHLMHILYQSCLILFFDKFLRWFLFHIHFTHFCFLASLFFSH